MIVTEESLSVEVDCRHTEVLRAKATDCGRTIGIRRGLCRTDGYL